MKDCGGERIECSAGLASLVETPTRISCSNRYYCVIDFIIQLLIRYAVPVIARHLTHAQENDGKYWPI